MGGEEAARTGASSQRLGATGDNFDLQEEEDDADLGDGEEEEAEENLEVVGSRFGIEGLAVA